MRLSRYSGMVPSKWAGDVRVPNVRFLVRPRIITAGQLLPLTKVASWAVSYGPVPSTKTRLPDLHSSRTTLRLRSTAPGQKVRVTTTDRGPWAIVVGGCQLPSKRLCATPRTRQWAPAESSARFRYDRTCVLYQASAAAAATA